MLLATVALVGPHGWSPAALEGWRRSRRGFGRSTPSRQRNRRCGPRFALGAGAAVLALAVLAGVRGLAISRTT